MLSEKTMLDVFIIWVQVIKNYIGIAGMTCCKYNDLKVATEVFKNLLSMRPDVYACLNYLASWEGDWKFDVVRRCQSVITMD